MQRKNQQKGQALIALLVFMVIAGTIVVAAIIGIALSATTTSKVHQGGLAYMVAESGAENGILRLLRDPTYTGEVLPVGQGSATITVSGTNPIILISKGQVGSFIRKVQVTIQVVNNAYTIQSWKEI